MPEEVKELNDEQIRQIITIDLERAISFLNAIRNDKELLERIVISASERYKVAQERKRNQPELNL